MPCAKQTIILQEVHMKKNDPHTKKVLRLFKWFLKCHGIVDQYKSNLSRDIRNDLWSEDTVKIDFAEDLVLDAFGWNCSPEGWDYWSAINKKWVEICHAFNL